MFLLLIIIIVGLLLLAFSLIEKPCTVYLAQPMTGYDKEEMVQKMKQAKFIFEQHGLKVWSPVLEEGVAGKGPLKATTNSLDVVWPMDKQALRYKCFVFVNLQADDKSFGCEREYGLMRDCYWRPCVMVSKKHAQGYKSIANYEDDGIKGEYHSTAQFVAENWGTFQKRRMWQLRMYGKSLLKWFGIHLWGIAL